MTLIYQHPLYCKKTLKQGSRPRTITDLTRRYEEIIRKFVLVSGRMQLRIHATFCPSDQSP
ncbi:hypothetical protein [Gluconobacter cerinus]|uniref:hypothetical protein n=1 Tax=Gluconobacter cerinus TaxID=38307 RepID=UPI0038D1B7EA